MTATASPDRAQDKVPAHAIRFRAPEGWMANQLMPGQYVDGDWRDGSRLQIQTRGKATTLAKLVDDQRKNIPMTDQHWREVRWDGVSVLEHEFTNFGYKYLERYIPGPDHRITYTLCSQPGPAENTTQRWEQSGRANCLALFKLVSFDKLHYRWGNFELKMIQAGPATAKPVAPK